MSEVASKIPQVTFITVVFNARRSLEQTIISINQLKYPNKKFIIVDGGSTDGTVDVIKQFEANIDCWISERDKGIYDAMNKGWNLAPIDSYIVFVGAGDTILSLPSALSFKLDEVVYGHVYKGEKIFKSTAGFKLLLGSTLHHQALLVPKTLHVNPPFDLKYTIYADFDFNQRLKKKGVKFRFDSSFKSYALPDGVSSVRDNRQMLNIVHKNFGITAKLVARLYYAIQRLKAVIGV